MFVSRPADQCCTRICNKDERRDPSFAPQHHFSLIVTLAACPIHQTCTCSHQVDDISATMAGQNTNRPFAAASSYASRFLQDSFAPFGASAGHTRDQAAPLFFSTIDGEAVLDEDSAAVLPQSALSVRDRVSGFGYGPEHHGRSIGLDDENDEEPASAIEDDHYGLGRQSSAPQSEDEEVASTSTSNDPFRPQPASSRSVASSSRGTSTRAQTTKKGWRMHATSTLPPIQQSVINDFYEQAESIYSSVFLHAGVQARALLKGKQRAMGTPTPEGQPTLPLQDTIRLGDEHEPPDFLTADKADGVDDHITGRAPGIWLPEKLARVVHVGSSTESSSQIYTDTEHPTRFRINHAGGSNRYPMPTLHYRRLALARENIMPGSLPSTADIADQLEDPSPRDPLWLAAFLSNLLFAILVAIWAFFYSSTSHLSIPAGVTILSPSLALARSIPLITGLVLVSCLFPGSFVAYILASSLITTSALRRMMQLMAAVPPFLLFVASGWAFASSFSADSSLDDISSTSTVSATLLRLLSLIFFGVSMLSLRAFWQSFASSRIERSARILSVAIKITAGHPLLFLVSAIMLFTSAIVGAASVLTMVRLLLHGHLVKLQQSQTPKLALDALVPSSGAVLLIVHAIFTYFWTVAALRGALRHIIAGTFADAWFSEKPESLARDSHDDQDNEKEYDVPHFIAAERVQAAVRRACGPSLGSICAGSLLLAITNTVTALLWVLNAILIRVRRFSNSGRPGRFAISVARLILNLLILPLMTLLASMIQSTTDYGITYSGVTGDNFQQSVAEFHQLVHVRNGTDAIVDREYLIFTKQQIVSLHQRLKRWSFGAYSTVSQSRWLSFAVSSAI